MRRYAISFFLGFTTIPYVIGIAEMFPNPVLRTVVLAFSGYMYAVALRSLK